MLSARNFRIRKKPVDLPYAWVPLTPPCGLKTFVEKRDWQLVLDSRNIEFFADNFNGRDYLYVSPIIKNIAEKEISSFYKENLKKPLSKAAWKYYKGSFWVTLFLLLPLLLYYVQTSLSVSLPVPWQDMGSLNNVKILIHHQWYRLVTALTLHANPAHLTGNIFFGSIFLILLARLTGCGRAWLLSILAAIAANFFCVITNDISYRSLGYSTAVFASLGVMTGIVILHNVNKKKIVLALGATFGLLAMLGTEGEHTDYGAHIAGLICGIFFGMLHEYVFLKKFRLLPQWLAGTLGVALILLAWICAFLQQY